MEEIIFSTYKKDEEGRNCLVLGKAREVFEERMIREANPNGFLRLLPSEKESYVYDISGKKALAAAFERVPMNAGQLLKIMNGILRTIEGTGEFLLLPECFLLLPEYIYLDFPEYEVSLCYYPEYHVPLFRQLGKLLESFLNRVDYREEKTISFVYGLYMLLQEPDVTLEKIKRRLQEESGEETVREEVFGEERRMRDILRSEEFGKNKQYGESRRKRTEREEKYSIEERAQADRDEPAERKRRGKKERKKNIFEALFQHNTYEDVMEPYHGLPAFVAEEPEEWGNRTRVLSVSEIKTEPSLVSERTQETVYMKKFPFFVGSSAGYSDLVIAKDTISRFHAKFLQADGEIEIFDLNSTNGTQVNGIPVLPNQGVKLRNGDRISFARESYCFFYGGKRIRES